jgi:dihydrolipoamide dehydrogenase
MEVGTFPLRVAVLRAQLFVEMWHGLVDDGSSAPLEDGRILRTRLVRDRIWGFLPGTGLYFGTLVRVICGRTLNLADICDLAVLGAGYGGCAVALDCAREGLRVVLIADADKPGGGLRTGARAVASIRRSAAEDASWGAAQGKRERDTCAAAAEVAAQCAAAGVVICQGRGRLAGPGRLVVRGPSEVERELRSNRIVLATGSFPQSPPGVVPDGLRIITSEHLLGGVVPGRSVLIAGAGPTGVELAALCRDLGSEVTLVEMREGILPAEDAESAAAVHAALVTDGVRIVTAHRITGATTGVDGVTVKLLDIAARTETTLRADTLLVTTGRRPASRDLCLDTAVVETDRSGHILVDGNCETSTPGLYAIGDLLATPRTADAALREAYAAAAHICGRPVAPLRWRRLPTWVSSRPGIASLGLTAAQAAAEGYRVRVERVGDARVVVDEEAGSCLGLQATGPGAIALVRGAAAILSPADAARPDPALLPDPLPVDLAAGRAVLAAAGISVPVA